jgi:hypothetical protein
MENSAYEEIKARIGKLARLRCTSGTVDKPVDGSGEPRNGLAEQGSVNVSA